MKVEKITHGHNKIYNSENSLRANAIDKKIKYKTVIKFTLEACYAVAIDEVREIIDFPENLIYPPGLPSYFKGVLNLRGDLITIVDARGIDCA